MAVVVKSLTSTAPTIDNSLPAQNDTFNVVPSANVIYDLYTTPTAKTAVVKNIRLVNTSSASVKVNVYFMRPNASGQHRRRQISPVDLVLAPGYLYIENEEVTLEPGDRIQAKADTASVIQYLLSGIERDQS
jgi:hypothetical protein